MDVKPGYKMTEVGVVPEDWEVLECEDLSTQICVGIVIRPTQYYTSSGVPALRSANIRESGIVEDSMVYISDRSNQLLAKSQVRTGDLVTVRTGYPGTTAVVPAHLSGANCIDVLICRPSHAVNNNFLCYWINSTHGKTQVLREQGGLAQQHFNVGDLRKLVVALPPTLPEQQAIAEALSDADALIESLDQLIAKKRQVKQGVMQQLLTGKQRLPGFEGEWVGCRVGDLLDICHGKNQSEVETPVGRYPILASGGEIGRTNDYLHPGPSVLIGRKGTIDKPQFMDTPFWTVDTLYYSKVNTDACAKFIFYLFCLVDWAGLNEASGVPSLNARTIESVPVIVPNEDEQRAIAQTLSDLDAELTALNAKRDKARLIKQGMMQELLTGKTRLLLPTTGAISC